MIALAKAKPGLLRYGSGGSGTPPHLCAEILKSSAGLDIVHVPYKGVTPALTDLLGGQVQFVFSVVPSALPLIQASKLRALGVTSARRTALAPDLPTIAETVPGFEVVGWYGLLAPKGTNAEIVTRLNAAAIDALKNADLRERLVALGADPLGSTPQAFATFIRAELVKWGKAVKDSGAIDLLRFRANLLRQFRPLREFGFQEHMRRIRSGGAADRLEAQRGDTLEHVGQLQILDEFHVQFGDNCRRRARRHQHAVPCGRVEARQARFRDRRHIRQARRTRERRDGERTNAAGPWNLRALPTDDTTNMSCTCSPISGSHRHCATVLYGTCTMFTPALLLNNSPIKWPGEPVPPEP